MSNYNLDHPEIAAAPGSPEPDAFVPQFSGAQYGSVAKPRRCRICSGTIAREYYLVRKETACDVCAENARTGRSTDNRGAFLWALVFAAAGAIFGMILYSAAAIATGWNVCYLAIAVGWIVGKAAQKGANGAGGISIQLAAVALTYAAISLSALPPIVIGALNNPGSIGDWGYVLRNVFEAGVTSPFLHIQSDPFPAALGILALILGIYIPWQLTQARSLVVDGPYSVAGA